jgi:hypothetical protein
MPTPSKPREFQVVLEFQGDDLANLDRVIALATKLEEELTSGEVDGHDVGGGIVNIVIDTKDPGRCFEEAMRIIRNSEPKPAAAGFREYEEDDYVRLLPAGDSTPFELI